MRVEITEVHIEDLPSRNFLDLLNFLVNACHMDAFYLFTLWINIQPSYR